MELTPQQIEDFKKQIIQQIESTFSEDKKGPAIEKVKAMNDEEFIEFLKKNKLLGSDSNQEEYEDSSQSQNSNESPFRLIVEGKIPSYVIDENKDCIAVLEIKPVSKGHIIIIPKKEVSQSDKIPKSVFSLAKRISKKIETKFKPKEVLISSSLSLGETIINILPVYSNETINSSRKQASKEELESLKNILEKKKKAKQARKPRIKKIEESKIWFPRRIP
jgi:histidine triad (HIT) family protein